MAAAANVVDFARYRASRKAREAAQGSAPLPVAMVPVTWVPVWFFYCHQPVQQELADGIA